MQALLLSKYLKLELVELPVPLPGPSEVLIRVEACGICGSDVHGFEGSSGRRIPPIVMGHEAAGTISALGDEVVGWSLGDRVTFDSTIYCGNCPFCMRDQVNLCDQREVIGVSCADYRRDGAFAEFIPVPQRILYRLPDGLSFVEASMVEAVSVALHAVRLSKFKAGESALVLGAGMIGTLIVQALRVEGASQIFVADLDASRLEGAIRAGAHHLIQLQERSAKGAEEALTQLPGGVDHVFEAVGIAATLKTAVSAVRKGGTVTLVGNIAAEAELPLQSVVTRQIRLQGSAASAGEYPLAIDLMTRGEIDVSRLISAIEPLSRGAECFERLYRREPGLTKIVLTPGEACHFSAGGR